MLRDTLICVSLNWFFQILCSCTVGGSVFPRPPVIVTSRALPFWEFSVNCRFLAIRLWPSYVSSPCSCSLVVPLGRCVSMSEMSNPSYTEMNFLKRETYWFKHRWFFFFFWLPFYNWQSVKCEDDIFLIKNTIWCNISPQFWLRITKNLDGLDCSLWL